MDREHVIATLRAHEPALRQRGVRHAALFGSVARGEAAPESDIDILIELEPEAPVGLFEYVGITQYLADLFPPAWMSPTEAACTPLCGQVPSTMLCMPSDRSQLALYLAAVEDEIASLEHARDEISERPA